MFRTDQDKLKEKKLKAMQEVTIDKNAFGLDSFEQIENFYENQALSNQTSNVEANNYIDSLTKNSNEESQANTGKTRHNTSNFTPMNKSQNMVHSSYNDILKTNNYNRLSKIVHNDLEVKLQEFEVKHEKKLYQQAAEDKKFESAKDKLKRKNKDLFEWLFIPSKFTILKKMVRQKLVEMIRDKCRFNKIEDAMHDYEMSKSVDENSQMFDFRIDIMLNNEIKLMLEREKNQLIESDPTHQYSKYEKLHVDNRENCYKNTAMTEEEPSRYHADMSDLKHSLKKSIIHNSFDNINDDITQFKGASFNSQSEILPDSSMIKKLDIKQSIPNKYFWNKRKENIYQHNKSYSKDWLKHSAPNKSVNYEDIGFSNFIQDILNNGQIKDLRDALLDKYMDGQWVTYKEIKYLDLTSEHLNMFQEKNIFKYAVQLLERECIEGIEMMIGNEIIDEYNLVKKNVKDSRQKYLSNKNKNDRKRQFSANTHSAPVSKERKTKQNQERKMLRLNKKEILKIINARLENLDSEEKDKFNKDIAKEKLSQEGFQKNSHLEKSFKIKSNDNFDEKKYRKNVSFNMEAEIKQGIPNHTHEIKNPIINDFLRRNYSVSSEVDTSLYGAMDERRIVHTKHPSSKLIYKEEQQIPYSYHSRAYSNRPQSSNLQRKKNININARFSTEYSEEKKYRKMDPEEQKYRLKINDDHRQKDKLAFHGANSGGPLYRLQSVRYKTRSGKIDRDRAAIMIQKIWRGHKARRKVGFNRPLFRTKFAHNGGKVDFKGIKFKKNTEKLNREILRKKKQTSERDSITNHRTFTNSSHPTNPDILKSYELVGHKNKPFNVMRNLNKSFRDNESYSKKAKHSLQTSLHLDQRDSQSKLSGLSPLANMKGNVFKSNNNGFNNSMVTNHSTEMKTGDVRKRYNKSYVDFLSTPAKNAEREEKREELFKWCINDEFTKIRNCVWTIVKSDIKSRDKKGNTALYYACQNENLEMIKFLLNRGAEPNDPNENGNTCMHIAFIKSNLELLKILVDHGGSGEVKNDFTADAYSYGSEYLAQDIRDYGKERSQLNVSVEINNTKANNMRTSNFTANKKSQVLLNSSIEQKKIRAYDKPWLLDSYEQSALSHSLNKNVVDANKAAESRRRAEKRKLVEQLETRRLYLPGFMPESHFGYS